jgi:hypothetical protein
MMLEILEHPGDGAVAESIFALGTADRAVDGQGAPAKGGYGLRDALPLLRRGSAGDEPSGRDCTSVDHGIERRTGLGIEADGIERLAARLDADPAQHGFASPIGQRGGIDRGLGDGLHRDFTAAFADGVGVAVGGDNADSEPVGIGLGELGDIGGNRSVVESLIFSVERVEVTL